MPEGEIRTFRDMDSASKELQQTIDPIEITTIQVIQVESLPKKDGLPSVVLIPSKEKDFLLAMLWDRPQLLEFAKRILRTYEPSFEDQILKSLNEIKDRLPEIPSKNTTIPSP